jgi:hypothetical protein
MRIEILLADIRGIPVRVTRHKYRCFDRRIECRPLFESYPAQQLLATCCRTIMLLYREYRNGSGWHLIGSASLRFRDPERARSVVDIRRTTAGNSPINHIPACRNLSLRPTFSPCLPNRMLLASSRMIQTCKRLSLQLGHKV